jgi:hypothetical protein
MRMRMVYRLAVLLALAAGLSPVHTLTQEELIANIQAPATRR